MVHSLKQHTQLETREEHAERVRLSMLPHGKYIHSHTPHTNICFVTYNMVLHNWISQFSFRIFSDENLVGDTVHQPILYRSSTFRFRFFFK